MRCWAHAQLCLIRVLLQIERMGAGLGLLQVGQPRLCTTTIDSLHPVCWVEFE
jgi:hypothetical protein